jgi:hypothetical protein
VKIRANGINLVRTSKYGSARGSGVEGRESRGCMGRRVCVCLWTGGGEKDVGARETVKVLETNAHNCSDTNIWIICTSHWQGDQLRKCRKRQYIHLLCNLAMSVVLDSKLRLYYTLHDVLSIKSRTRTAITRLNSRVMNSTAVAFESARLKTSLQTV